MELVKNKRWILAGTAVKDIILGREVTPIAVNIYNGIAIAPYYKEHI
jgi:hypothetical protein